MSHNCSYLNNCYFLNHFFQFRGASNAVGKLVEDNSGDVPHDQITVVTHSSGNHGQAIALASKLRGVKAHIVMPFNAPVVKKNAIKGYGALITECENTKEVLSVVYSVISADNLLSGWRRKSRIC